VLEVALDARRGSFHLQIECRLASEWTVVFGPSGAGKSTLLRLLAGLDRPDRGRIALDGSFLTDSALGLWLKPGPRHTSMVTQQPALFPHLSVASNVAYGLGSLNRASRARRVEEMLDLVGATDLPGYNVRQLSGGEAQRVALARALAPQSRLLLLTSPFPRSTARPAMLCWPVCNPGSSSIASRPSWPRTTLQMPSPLAPKLLCCVAADWPHWDRLPRFLHRRGTD